MLLGVSKRGQLRIKDEMALGRYTESLSLLIGWKVDYVNSDVGRWVNVVVRIFH